MCSSLTPVNNISLFKKKQYQFYFTKEILLLFFFMFKTTEDSSRIKIENIKFTVKQKQGHKLPSSDVFRSKTNNNRDTTTGFEHTTI